MGVHLIDAIIAFLRDPLFLKVWLTFLLTFVITHWIHGRTKEWNGFPAGTFNLLFATIDVVAGLGFFFLTIAWVLMEIWA